MIKKILFFQFLLSLIFSNDAIQLEKKIYFESNSYELSQRAKEFLDNLAPLLKIQEGLKNEVFDITGHSDASGEEEKNRELSKKRACEVKDYLTKKHDLEESRFTCIGAGSDIPVADNSIEEGKTLNRRVVISKQKGASAIVGEQRKLSKAELEVEYSYDELGRIKKAAYSDGRTIAFEYDEVGNILKRSDF
ncbi:MAG: hypothetical protein QG567_260 [Campylobacterota bacterium]|nr:hypothetical protein [Campylobacterota bacterium]